MANHLYSKLHCLQAAAELKDAFHHHALSLSMVPTCELFYSNAAINH